MRRPDSTETNPDWSTPWKPSFLGAARNILREALINLSLYFMEPDNGPLLIVFPSGKSNNNPASLLRAYSIGATLRKTFNWRVIIIPPEFTLNQRLRIIHSKQPDVILMQMERHPLNRPQLYKPFPVIFDIDDADFLWEHANEIVTECCKGSTAVIAGSRFIEKWVRQHNKNTQIIWTASPLKEIKIDLSQVERKPVVAWGHSRPQDYPSELNFIKKILEKVVEEISIEFWLFGVPDNEIGKKLKEDISETGVAVSTFSPMPFEQFTKKLSSVPIGLQVLSSDNSYSEGKSFGKILNYLLAKTCVIASPGADHSLFFNSGTNGILAESVNEWVDAIVWLLKNPVERSCMAENAYLDFQRHLTTNAVGEEYNLMLRKYARSNDKT